MTSTYRNARKPAAPKYDFSTGISPLAPRRKAQAAMAASPDATAFRLKMLAGMAAFAAGILVWQSTGFTAPRYGEGFVYTADEYGNSISRIDLATGKADTVKVAITPHNVDLAADGALLAVGEPVAETGGTMDMSNMSTGGDDEAEAEPGLLLVFDPDDLAAGPISQISVGEHPAHVIAEKNGSRAFVTNSEDDNVSVIDLATGKAIATIATGRFPHGLRLSPDGQELYVANVQDGSVSVLGASNLAELARIPVGAAPVQVGFTPDGSKVYVSLRDENSVAVIDTASREVVTKIAVGRNPIQVYATPDGARVYVANQGSEADPDETVSVIDTASGRVVDTIRTGKGAHGVSISPDARVFVSNIADGTVSVISDADRSVVATIPVGTSPNGIVFRTVED